ncbi:hypothetical protein BHE74_00004565 [Ensete ventricosum]|nr:hypothetical protein BHE74_00004565 [Ensete ventricosum]
MGVIDVPRNFYPEKHEEHLGSDGLVMEVEIDSHLLHGLSESQHTSLMQHVRTSTQLGQPCPRNAICVHGHQTYRNQYCLMTPLADRADDAASLASGFFVVAAQYEGQKWPRRSLRLQLTRRSNEGVPHRHVNRHSNTIRRSIMSTRSGSSGLVWDERLFSGDLTQMKKKEEEEEEEEGGAAEFSELRHSKSVGSIGVLGRSHSTGGGRGFRAGAVLPAVDPPSPQVPRCVCCGFLGKHGSAKPRRR